MKTPRKRARRTKVSKRRAKQLRGFQRRLQRDIDAEITRMQAESHAFMARDENVKPRREAFVSINAHTIRGNAINGTDNPPIRIARSKSDRTPRYAREIEIAGPSRLVYDPCKKLLACGARLVLVAAADDVRILR